MPSVWLGGIVTLLVVAVTARLALKLRMLSLDPKQAAKEIAESLQDEMQAGVKLAGETGPG